MNELCLYYSQFLALISKTTMQFLVYCFFNVGLLCLFSCVCYLSALLFCFSLSFPVRGASHHSDPLQRHLVFANGSGTCTTTIPMNVLLGLISWPKLK